ncbi:MAG: hypothetical protein ACREIF_16700 [Chthoniobacterales bacterium]
MGNFARFQIDVITKAEQLRINFLKSHWRYDKLTPAQQEALLCTKKYAERPQPVDYGLSRYDVCLHRGRYPLNDDLKYREEPDRTWRRIFLMAFIIYGCGSGGMLYLYDSGQLKGTPSQIVQLAILLAPASLFGSVFLFQIIEPVAAYYWRKRTSSAYSSYQEAIQLHMLYQAAAHEAEQAVLRTKRSYWAFLDG